MKKPPIVAANIYVKQHFRIVYSILFTKALKSEDVNALCLYSVEACLC